MRSKRQRRIPVADITLEPEAVALAQQIALQFAEPDFQRAFQHVDASLACEYDPSLPACDK